MNSDLVKKRNGSESYFTRKRSVVLNKIKVWELSIKLSSEKKTQKQFKISPNKFNFRSKVPKSFGFTVAAKA